MLYVNYKIEDRAHTLEWERGKEQTLPSDHLDREYIQIMSVLADGYELEHIATYFRNIPFVMYPANGNGKPGFCIWRGEMARFIVDNLREV